MIGIFDILFQFREDKEKRVYTWQLKYDILWNWNALKTLNVQTLFAKFFLILENIDEQIKSS